MLERIKNFLNIKSKNEELSPFERIDNMFDSLNSDIVQIQVGSDIISFEKTLFNVIGEIREEIKSECGFIIPPVKITDNNVLQENEYAIFIRGIKIKNGYLVPRSENIKIEIYEELKSTIYENLDKIFTNEITEKYINSVQKNNSWLIWNVTNILSVIDIKTILTDIINKGQSIHNINYIFEKIGEEILANGEYQNCSKRYNPHAIATRVSKLL